MSDRDAFREARDAGLRARHETERRALHLSACVLCGHALIEHHWASLRCQHSSKRHWWSRRIQCSCEMRPA